MSWSAVDRCWRGGNPVEVELAPKRLVGSRGVENAGSSNKEDMGTATKAAVNNLKTLEAICRDEDVDRDEFLRVAKETAFSVHALMRMAQERSLTTVHDVLSENVGRVIGLGKELVKEKYEAGESADAVLETEFVAAMKAMGESIKAFIHAYREATKEAQPQPVRDAPKSDSRRIQSSVLSQSTSSMLTGLESMGFAVSAADDGSLRERVRADVQYDNAELSGWLTKQGGGVKSWKRRWCVLKDGFISYFKEAEDTTPLGAIPLEGCNSVTMHHAKTFCFAVTTPYRMYLLRAESMDQAESWISAVARYVIDAPTDVTKKSKVAQLRGEDERQRKVVKSTDKVDFKSGVDLEGWLTKSGSNGRNWKKRWCVLKESIIYYFRSEKESLSGTPLGVIPLQDCRMEEVFEESKNIKMIAIHTRHRTYKLQAETPIMAEWIEAIHDSVKSLGGEQGDHNSRRARKIEAMATAQTMELTYKTNATKVRVAKRYLSEYPDDPAVNEVVEEMLGELDFNAPDRELDNWTNVMAVYLAKQSKRQRANIRIIPAELTSAPLAPTFPTDFLAYFHVPQLRVYKAIKCFPNQTAADVIPEAISKIKRLTTPAGQELLDRPTEEFVLKIVGRSEFVLNPSTPLHKLVHVREFVNRWQKLEFIIMFREDLKELEDNHDRALVETEELVKKEQEKVYPIYEVDSLFVMKVVSVTRFRDTDFEQYVERSELQNCTMYLECGLYFGGKRIGSVMRTKKAMPPLWEEQVQSNITFNRIPKETRLCATLFLVSDKREFAVAWVNLPVIDFNDHLRSGVVVVPMTPHENANYLASVPNYDSPIFHLTLEFLAQKIPVVHAIRGLENITPEPMRAPTPQEEVELNRLAGLDPLYKLTVQEKELLWKYREWCKQKKPYFLMLPKILIAVDWTQPEQVAIVQQLLKNWPSVPPVNALELLGGQFSDTKVRFFAVKCLYELRDHELADYLLQLVQALKYETYYDSALSKYLLIRSLANRAVVGQPFFWHLMAECRSSKSPVTRYAMLLEAYLRGCGEHRGDLQVQWSLVKQLRDVAAVLKNVNPADRNTFLRSKLQQLQMPPEFTLPLSAGMRVTGICVEKCKWLSSVTVPLWLAFECADPIASPILVIFKDGDDMRQDVLTLQMFRIMDKMWKSNGCHLYLTPYLVVATAEDCGFIEVVLNSQTTGEIQREKGGASAAFKKTPLAEWLAEKNKAVGGPERLRLAVNNFIASLAGYCVATYVLGIGDRHNDNIMIQQSGHLFHIDFAHFLGNIMKFAGIKRERAPFVLTPEFAFVITGSQEKPEKSRAFAHFIQLACTAYNLVRQNASKFIALFQMMLSTGIPELSTNEDLSYLREALNFELTEEQAAKHFQDLIFESLRTKTTQLNNYVHLIANPEHSK